MTAKVATRNNAPVQRQSVDNAGDFAEVRRLEMLLDVAGTEEHERLGDAVIKHVEQRAENAPFAAKADRGHHDAGVVDARVGEDAAKVALHQDEGRSEQNGADAKADQEVFGERVARRIWWPDV